MFGRMNVGPPPDSVISFESRMKDDRTEVNFLTSVCNHKHSVRKYLEITSTVVDCLCSYGAACVVDLLDLGDDRVEQVAHAVEL